ncbi:hypothetical protein IP88_02870 [alpha proteobacterium AAP81b]|nr:hypothetical protein IP88_02870 [alpha proteobacterium AAP81b]
MPPGWAMLPLLPWSVGVDMVPDGDPGDPGAIMPGCGLVGLVVVAPLLVVGSIIGALSPGGGAAVEPGVVWASAGALSSAARAIAILARVMGSLLVGAPVTLMPSL